MAVIVVESRSCDGPLPTLLLSRVFSEIECVLPVGYGFVKAHFFLGFVTVACEGFLDVQSSR
jgi:hypothetical protein